MKGSNKMQRIFRKPAVLAVLYGCALLFVLVIYGVDILVWKNPPAKNLTKVLLVLAALAFSLFQIIKRHRTNVAVVKKAYADKIENIFTNNKAKKRKLLAALIDYNLDDYSEGIKKLDKLFLEAGTVEERCVTKYFKALCYKKWGESDVAAELYREILEETPDYAPALSNLSVCYYEKQNYKKAIEFAEKALVYNGDNPFAYHNLAGAYAKIYELEKAKKYALRAYELKKELYQASALLSMISAAEGNVLTAKKYAQIAVSMGQNADNLASAVRDYKADYARHLELLERIAHWKQKTGIPSIHFTLDGAFTKSIIGGQMNEPAPVSVTGKTMRLLAAIFCSELPENDIFPKHGVLRFYISPDNYLGAGFDNYGEMNIQKEFRVLFDEDELAFSTSDDYGPKDEYFPVTGSYHPRFTLAREGMPVCDFRFEETKEGIFENSEDETDAARAYDEEFLEEINPMGHKLGGYPCFTQEDPRGDHSRYSTYDTLLFQLDSDYNGKDIKVMFGDSGVCNFFIPREKLERHDFSDILYTWDCF